jgi:hypothetical protein
LNTLQSQIQALQQPTKSSSALIRHKALPGRFLAIQNASQKLHEALCNAWCCDDADHRAHYAKLCLDAEVKAEVSLDLAISCHEAPTGVDNGLVSNIDV